MVMIMQTKVYAARLKNKKELYSSSSGGVFSALTNLFLNHDYILSSVYNYDTQELEYMIFNDIETRNRARGSKYFQSKIGNSFKEAIKLLKDNPEKKMLFVGMGCQADGFRKLCELSGVRNRVYIVDIICTGNPSAKVWKTYISRFDNVSYISFKDKRNGWYHPTAIAVSNGREVGIESWLKIFYGHNADKPSCCECPFASTDRKADMTIGDFWRIEKNFPDFYDENGNSVILIHTEKGLELFNLIKKELEYQESDLKACWQNRLYSPPERPVTRKAFWRDYQKNGIEYVIKKYSKMPLWGKILTKIKRGVKKVKSYGING